MDIAKYKNVKSKQIVKYVTHLVYIDYDSGALNFRLFWIHFHLKMYNHTNSSVRTTAETVEPSALDSFGNIFV